MWNERPPEATAFLDDYEALLLRHSAEYSQVKAGRADEASMRRFFGGAMELATFPNQQTLDFEGLKGRLMSSSYAPEPGDPQHQPMMAGLQELFGRHQHRGQVVFPYRTLVYFGQPQRPGRNTPPLEHRGRKARLRRQPSLEVLELLAQPLHLFFEAIQTRGRFRSRARKRDRLRLG